jgi:WD40 repeat protein/class 3 adenylate cyclase
MAAAPTPPTATGSPDAASRIAVLIFSDLVGSTALPAKFGATACNAALRLHNESYERLAAEEGITIVKFTGDGYFSWCPSAAGAVRFALRFQQELRDMAWGEVLLATRLGIHLGEVSDITAAGHTDLIGSAANLASRIMSVGLGGQILLSRAPFDEGRLHVSAHPPSRDGEAPALEWLAHGPYRFNGYEEPIEVFEVGAKGHAPLIPPLDAEKAKRALRPGDEETLGWRPAEGLEIPGRLGWRIAKKLGAGGFGEVWAGQHAKTRERRAFKFCFDAERLRALKREVTLTRLLRETLGEREDIVRIFDLRLDAPPYFLESELSIDGNLLQWAEKQGGLAIIPLEARLELVAATATALAAAHSVGVLHKDIKPTNVLIFTGKDGRARPRLVDFGIGTLADSGVLARHGITGAGFTAATLQHSSGTPTYSPPEYLAGRPFTVQGDVYSLGVMLWQLVTAKADQPLAEGWQRDVPDALLREDIALCADGDPARRLPSAAELATRLRALPERAAEAARRVAAEAAEAAWRRNRKRFITIGAAVLLIGVTVVGGVTARQDRRRAEERRKQAAAYYQVHQATLYLDRGAIRPALTLLAEAFSAHPDFTTRSAFLAALIKAPKQLESAFTGFKGGVQRLQFGPHDVLAAAAGGSLRLLDTRRPDVPGPAFVTASEQAPTILGMALGSNGTWQAQREDGKMITLRPGGDAAHLADRRNALRLAAFSQDGRRFAGVDATNPKEIATGASDDPGKTVPVAPFADEVAALAFAPDGALAVATEKGAIFLIPAVGEMRSLGAAGPAKVRCLAWRTQGEPLLAAGDANGNIAIVKNGSTTQNLMNVPGGIQDLAWSPDGQALAAACTDGTIRKWIISEALDAPVPTDVIPAHKGPVLSIAWSADGSHLASGGDDETVCIWHLFAVFGPVTTHDKGVPLYSLAVSADGKRVAAGSKHGDIFIWERGNNGHSGIRYAGSDGPNETVLCLAWQPGQDRVASGRKSGEIKVWQQGKRDPVLVNSGDSGTSDYQDIERVRWSPDGKKLASTSHTGAVQIWEPDGGAPPRLIGRMNDLALGLAWSPDGATLGAGSTHGEIWLWKTAGGAESVLKIPKDPRLGHGDSISGLAYLPGEKVVASCGRDGTLRLWDARSGAALGHTPPVGGPLEDLAHSENGAEIAVAGADGYLRIWETDPLVPKLAVSLHRGRVASLAWNGGSLFSASEDGMVCIIDLDETKWTSRARQVIGVAVGSPSVGKKP